MSEVKNDKRNPLHVTNSWGANGNAVPSHLAGSEFNFDQVEKQLLRYN